MDKINLSLFSVSVVFIFGQYTIFICFILKLKIMVIMINDLKIFVEKCIIVKEVKIFSQKTTIFSKMFLILYTNHYL